MCFFFNSLILNHALCFVVVLSVRVVEAWAVSHVTFPTAEEVNGTPWEQIEDSVHLPMQAVLGATTDGK